MPRNLKGDDPNWTRRFVSPAKDFVLREKVKDDAAARMQINSNHKSQTAYPGFVLSGFTPADEEGWQFAYYCKTRDSQEAYNWQHAQLLEMDFPEVRQTWVILRSDHATSGGVARTPPPSLGGHTWTYCGYREQDLDDTMSGLFVAIEHVYKDISQPLRGEIIDLTTNTRRAATRTMVAAGTAAQPVGADGRYTQITPINSVWAWQDSKQALGVAGDASNGRAVRTIRLGDQWPLPAVLNYVAIIPVHVDPSNIYSEISRYITVPKFLVNGGAYPCKITIVERWYAKAPVWGGNPNWDASMTTQSPDLPVPEALLDTPIDFNGNELFVNVASCLHQAFSFWDTGYSDTFPATNYVRWPSTFLARVQNEPDQGGWLVREWYVDPPAQGQSTGLDLTQYGDPAATSAVIQWTANSGAAVTTKLDVSTSPNFDGGWLAGYRDKDITPSVNTPPLRHTVTGLERGVIYFARVRRSAYTVGLINYPAVTSNMITILGKPQPEIVVKHAGVQLLSGATLHMDSVEVGSTLVDQLRIESVGVQTLRDITAVLSTGDSTLFDVGSNPGPLVPGGYYELELRFLPTSQGSKTCTLTITSNAADSPFVLTLQATGTAPEITLEQPAGTNITTGGTSAFGTLTTGSFSKVFKLRNTGNAPLRGLTAVITGNADGDFQLTAPLTVTEIAAGEFVEFTVTFDPVESEVTPHARTGVLSITSTDADENPFTVNLTGTYLPPTAPGAVDSFDPNANGAVMSLAYQPDGKLLMGGDFTEVASTPRNRLARLNADDTLDAGFDPDVNGTVYAIAVQPDGTIWIGGSFTTVGGVTRNRIALINADGTLNAADPDADGIVRCISVMSVGDVMVGGDFANIGGGAKPWLARLESTGALDTGFTSEVNGRVNGITFQADGQILIVGDWAEATTTTTTEETTTTTTPETTTTTTEETTTTTTTEETTTTTTPETTTTTTTEETTTTTTTEETTTTTTTEETTTTTTPETTTTTTTEETTTTTTTEETTTTTTEP